MGSPTRRRATATCVRRSTAASALRRFSALSGAAVLDDVCQLELFVDGACQERMLAVPFSSMLFDGARQGYCPKSIIWITSAPFLDSST